jgi:hypothetical protein
MSRHRTEGHSKQTKDHARRNWDESTTDGRAQAGERERVPGKMHKTHGIREDEARRQIRELWSRH